MVHLELASVDVFKRLCNLNVLDSHKKYIMTSSETVLLEMNEDIDNTTNYLPYSVYNDHEIIGFLMIIAMLWITKILKISIYMRKNVIL